MAAARIRFTDSDVKVNTILVAPAAMNQLSTTEFRRRREDDWKDLENLCLRFEKNGWKRIPAKELENFGALYRRTAAHLAQVRNRPKEKRLEGMLNQLLTRAHGHLYRPTTNGFWARLGHYLLHGFPEAVQHFPRHILLSALLLVGGFFISWLAVNQNPDLYYATVPIGELRSPGASPLELQESLTAGRDSSTGSKTVFFGFLWQHNVKISLLAFALGVLAGIPTALLIFYNGMLLGAMTSVFQSAGLGTAWWAWIAGHGVTELTAIVFAGGAGFVLGEAVLWPKNRSRAEALNRAAKPALAVVGGTVMMLFVAALLEAFFRQSEASNTVRFLVAGISALLWLAYFGVMPWLKARRDSATLNTDSTSAP